MKNPIQKSKISVERKFISLMRDFSEQKLNYILASILMIISYLQIFSLFSDINDPFLPTSNSSQFQIQTNDFLLSIIDFGSFFTLKKVYMDYWIVYIVLFIIFGTMLTLMMTFFCHNVIKGYDFILLKFVPRRFMVKLLAFYGEIFYLPYHLLFLAIFQEERLIQEIKSTDQTALNSQYAFCLIFLFFNLVLGFCSHFYVLVPFEDDQNALSRISNLENKILWFFKTSIGAVVLINFEKTIIYSCMRIAFCMVIFGYLFFDSLYFPNYYNAKISKLSISLKGVGFIINLGLIIDALMYQSHTNSSNVGFIILIFCSIWVIKFGRGIFKVNMENILSSQGNTLFNPSLFIFRQREFFKLLGNLSQIQKGSESSGDHINNQLIVQGLITRHIALCRDSHCICKHREELYDSVTKTVCNLEVSPYHDKIFLAHFGDMLLSEGLNYYKKNTMLEINAAYYEAKVLKKAQRSLIDIQIVKQKALSLNHKIMIAIAEKMISQLFYSKYDESRPSSQAEDTTEHELIDSKKVLDVEAKMELFRGKITEAVSRVVAFWNMLRQPSIELLQIYKLSAALEVSHQEIQRVWKSIEETEHYSKEFFYLVYGLYLTNIRNEYIEGAEKIKKACKISMKKNAKTKINFAITSKTLFEKDTACLKIFGDKKSLGKIIKSTQNISEIFGTSSSTISNKNINCIIPSIYGKNHDSYLIDSLETGKEYILNDHRVLFGKHTNGHVFPINIYIKVNPEVSEGLTYIGAIKPIMSYECYILTDLAGIIDSISLNLSQDLTLNPHIFQRENISIYHLCPEITEVLEAFNYFLYQEHGAKIFEHYKKTSRIKSSSLFLRGHFRNIFNNLVDIGSKELEMMDHNTELYNAYKKTYSNNGAKLNLSVPVAISDFNATYQKFSMLDEIPPGKTCSEFEVRSDDIPYVCKIRDMIYRDRDVVRVISLKPTTKNDNIDLEYLHDPISIENLNKSKRRHSQQRGTQISHQNSRMDSNYELTPPIPSKYKPKSPIIILPEKIHIGHIIDVPSTSVNNNNDKSFVSDKFLNITEIEMDYKMDYDEHYQLEKQELYILDAKGVKIPEAQNPDNNEENYQKQPNVETHAELLADYGQDGNVSFQNSSMMQLKETQNFNDTQQLKLKQKRKEYFESSKSIKKSDKVSKTDENNIEKKFQVNLFKAFQREDDDRTSSVSKASNTEGFFKLYTKAVNEPYHPYSFVVIKRMMLIATITTIISALAIFFVDISSIESTEANVQIQRVSTELNYNTIGLGRRAGFVVYIAEGINSVGRYITLGNANHYTQSISNIRALRNSLDANAVIFYNALQNFSQSFRESVLSEEIPYYEYNRTTGKYDFKDTRDMIQMLNFFISQSSIATKYSMAQVKQNVDGCKDLLFTIGYNAMNSMLLYCDKLNDILSTEISEQNNHILYLSHVITGVILGILCLMIIGFIHFFLKLTEEKIKCLHMATVIENNDIENMYFFLQNFKSIINAADNSSEGLLNRYQKAKATSTNLFKKLERKKQHKHIIKSGFYSNTVSHILRVVLVLVVVIGYFAYTLVSFNTYMELNSRLLNQIDVVLSTLVMQSYLWEAVKEVIGGNATDTFLNQNVELSYYKIYDVLKEDQFSDVFYANQGQVDPDLDALLKGDMCTFNSTICYRVNDGTLAKGAVQFQSYYFNALTTIFNTWNSLRYTNYNKTLLLDQTEMIEAEYAFVSVLRNRYLLILNYLNNKFSNNNNDQINLSGVLIGCFISLLLVFAGLVWIPLSRSMDREQYTSKNVFRLIPPEIVQKNSYIKVYMKKISEKSLSAYRI